MITRKNTFLYSICLLFTTISQAQSWAAWQDLTPYLYPDKWFWIYPTSIQQFKTAKTQYWQNNVWRDSTQITQTFNALCVAQTAKAALWSNNSWVEDGTSIYNFDNNARLTKVEIGIGNAPSFKSFIKINNTFDGNGALQKSLTEKYNLKTGLWEPSTLDSIVGMYSFSMNWDEWSQKWVTIVRDSARTTIVSPAATGQWLTEGRITYTRNAANQVTQLQWEVPKTAQPLVWDTDVVKFNYLYNIQNQLIEIQISGTGVMKDRTIGGIRYQFTLNAAGKIVEELEQQYVKGTQNWENATKTIYSYYSIGSKNLDESNELQIAPNPAQQGWTRLTIQSQNNSIQSIDIYDALGRLMDTQKVDNKQHFDLDCTKWGAGNYFLKVHTNKGVISKKLLVL